MVDARLLPSVSSPSGISPSIKGSLIDGMDMERTDCEPLSLEGGGTCSVRVEADSYRGSVWKVALVGVGVFANTSFALKPVLSPSVSLNSSNAASSRRFAKSPWPGLAGTSTTLPLTLRRCRVSGGARLAGGEATSGSLTLRWTTALKVALPCERVSVVGVGVGILGGIDTSGLGTDIVMVLSREAAIGFVASSGVKVTTVSAGAAEGMGVGIGISAGMGDGADEVGSGCDGED